ncbi:MAG: hypothetical protein K6B46_02640 [Opitutales bacterium]|nr:hypothetical protein [Opitutales bacterium]
MNAFLKHLLFSSALFLLALFSFVFDEEIDRCSNEYFEDAISKATITFVTARTANATISVVKSTEVSAEPLGVGVTVGVGEILDPVDDVIETLSNVMFTAVVSLSVQKISYVFAALIGKTGLLFIAGTMLLSYPLRYWKWGDWACDHLLRVFILLLLLRCLLPLCALLNIGADRYFFQPHMAECNETISIVGDQSSKFWDEIWNNNHSFTQRFDYSKRYSKKIFKNASKIVDASVAMTGFVIAQFCLQVIILPMASFFIFRIVIKKLYGHNLPLILKPKSFLNRKREEETEEKISAQPKETLG